MKFLDQCKKKLADITIEDMIVCPIDDHMTLGVQKFVPNKMLPDIPTEKNNNIYLNNLIMPNILII